MVKSKTGRTEEGGRRRRRKNQRKSSRGTKNGMRDRPCVVHSVLLTLNVGQEKRQERRTKIFQGKYKKQVNRVGRYLWYNSFLLMNGWLDVVFGDEETPPSSSWKPNRKGYHMWIWMKDMMHACDSLKIYFKGTSVGTTTNKKNVRIKETSFRPGHKYMSCLLMDTKKLYADRI